MSARQVMLFYSALCEEGPQYSSKLIEKFGVCPFLDSILGDVKVDKRSYFPLSCLVSANYRLDISTKGSLEKIRLAYIIHMCYVSSLIYHVDC